MRGCDPRAQTVLGSADASGVEVELVAVLLERLRHRRLVTDDCVRGLRTRWIRTTAGDIALEWGYGSTRQGGFARTVAIGLEGPAGGRRGARSCDPRDLHA